MYKGNSHNETHLKIARKLKRRSSIGGGGIRKSN
jgi:hypothetical protein